MEVWPAIDPWSPSLEDKCGDQNTTRDRYINCDISDINECKTDENRCEYKPGCGNTQGSYTCNCSPGFDLNADGWSCKGQNKRTWLYYCFKMYLSRKLTSTVYVYPNPQQSTIIHFLNLICPTRNWICIWVYLAKINFSWQFYFIAEIMVW